MHTYELPGSGHKNGCEGLVVVPKSQGEKFRGGSTEEALFAATTAIHNKFSGVTLTVFQHSLHFI
jgi:hypothetical protein